jgi:hypothetical protein
MIGKSNKRAPQREGRRRDSGYFFIARGSNGRVRAERFTDVASYRARLARLVHSDDRGLSVDDIAKLLDGEGRE